MEEFGNLIGLGIVGVFVIGLGIWIHWKLGAKKRAAMQRATAAAERQRANGGANSSDDFEEEFLVSEDNSLPDDSDGEFKDTNLFGLKRRKDGLDVFRDWD